MGDVRGGMRGLGAMLKCLATTSRPPASASCLQTWWWPPAGRVGVGGVACRANRPSRGGTARAAAGQRVEQWSGAVCVAHSMPPLAQPLMRQVRHVG